MKIESYKIYKVSIPTRRRHTWASSTADVGQGWVILEVKTDDGIVGYGEATTMPEWGGDFGRYYGESYETTEVVIRDNLFPAIAGMDPFDIDLIHHRMDKAIRGFVYAKAAIDIALYDIMGKALDKPVYKLLGGQHRKAIPIAHSLGVVLDIEAAVDEAVAACDNVKWLPAWGKDRMVAMIRDRADWCISRQRRWGLPIPVFYCKDCGKPVCTPETIAHISALFGEHGSNIWFEREAMELVPEGLSCPHCGGRTFEKETDTLDGWFDSGSTHIASLRREHPDQWPATMYLEGADQYRGWFQSSLLTSVGALGQGAPFRECLTHGWTVDGEGKAMHKSLGNGVDPADVFKKYGADICRLWAGSADYHVDVRCSDEIFKQLSQNYLKFRNTAKFCLDNLTDFDPNQLTAPADMEALDRWAITKLNELLVKCEAAYQNYEFLTVSHAVNDFCVVTLSSLYLDIIKDRLYCDGADSAARRSAQSALWIILDAMTKVFAPILAFTCDEIWLQMPHRNGDDGRNVLLNQMSKPYADYALSDAEMAVWETALRVRSDVNGVLETARADKRIGKSLEAHVALFANDEDAKAALDAVKSVDLPEIFIVSNVSTNETAPAEGAVVGQGVNFPGLTIAVTEAKGTKCPRCWMHSESPDEHGLCPRCAAVCKALGVVFE